MPDKTMQYVFLQQQFIPLAQAKIAINDRGFLLGDGIFETLRVYKGQALFLQEHLNRLQQGAEFIKISLPYPLEFLQTAVKNLIIKNNLVDQDAVLRLTLTRGSGPRGLSPSQNFEPTLLMATHPFADLGKDTLAVLCTQFCKNECSGLTRVKSLNYLENILARQEAVSAGYDEALLRNTKGAIVSASAANVFWVKDGKLFTPAIEEGALPGITRAVIIELAHAVGIPIIECSFCYEDIGKVDECFLTNSLLGIQQVMKIDQYALEHTVPITTTLKVLYQKHLQQF